MTPPLNNAGHRPPSPVSHAIGLAVAAIGLGLTLCFLIARSRQVFDMLCCGIQLRNIHNSVLSWAGVNNIAAGQRLRWEEIIGPGMFVPEESWKCPSGDDYELSPLLPHYSKPVARCPHPEHQEYFMNHECPEWLWESQAK